MQADQPVRWGILGPGSIARQFVSDLSGLEQASLAAVASRSMQRALQFAEEYGFARAYDSYQALADDPQVDIIYVATPHPFHKEHTLLSLQGGKAVLCEKPLGINAAQVQEMIDQAQRRDLFLMEAMWTRFLPVMARVREWLDQDRIGKVRLVQADFGFCTPWQPKGRLLNPELAGGALLDVGVYVVALAAMILGSDPERIQASGHLGKTGVDEQTALLLSYADGAIADLFCAVRTETQQKAIIYGSKGRIEIPDFWHAESALLQKDDRILEKANGSAGYQFEAAYAMACLEESLTESAIMPLADSLAIAKILEKARQQLGLQYPMEGHS